MGSLNKLLAICLLLLLAHTEAARENPLKDPRICGRPQCETSNAKFSYGEVIYKYDYTVSLRTEFAGSGDNTSDLYLKANLDIFFPKPCEGYLRINEAKLYDKFEDPSSEDSPTSEKPYVFDYYADLSSAESSSAEHSTDFDNMHPKSMDLAYDLKKNVLRFAFHDGLVSEVCPLLEETPWVLNFKKGILSAFQNTMMRFDVDFNTTETDVSGECQVQYALESTDTVYVTIRKTKDISTCRRRYSTHSVLQTTPYTFRDDKTIWPILNSQSYCNLTIDNHVYRDISCFERHLLIPFSNASTGALTTSYSKFELKGEESYSRGEFLEQNNELIERRSSLIFDHTPLVKPTHGEIKAARELLKEMCAVGFPNIQREFIDVFTNFLQTTKTLDYKALTVLLQRAASICEQGKNHVLESLPYIGSTASYKVMRDQIVADTLPKDLAHSWMTSLSFITRPDEETLETFYTILDHAKKKLDPVYTLGASAVIHSYCKYHENCGEHLKVQQVVNLLETEFLSSYNMYRGDRRQRERLIVLLKGLGNMGAISAPFAEQLQWIIKDDVAPVDIRLQGILAFRRADCALYRPFFLDSYANYTLNSELRIYSYLQAMRCPDYISIALIKTILEHEKINQVGSFVWSHLHNLAKSNSPVRIEAQGLLLNDDLSDKFKLDIRKYSRNYEHSLFFDEYNFGTTTDANLIFGTDSYLPRMASVNFTADLFGQSVNFFEFTARAEGFEQLVASAFGPKGPLNSELLRKKLSFLNRWLGTESAEEDDTLENLLSFENLRLKRKAHQAAGGVEQQDDEDYDFESSLHDSLSRSKREINASARKESIERNVDQLGYKLKYDYSNPRAQFGMRIFGNDLRYYTVESMLEVMGLFKEFDPFHQAYKVLSGKEFTYTKSRVFLDASYNVPLAVGMPLAIHAFGASSVDLRISGSLERMEPHTDYHFDVEGRFKPSVSLDVITTMLTDMYWGQSGIKVKSNLYSNSEVEAKLKVRGPTLISFAFNLPQDRNEIFSARSELLVMKHDKELPQLGIERRSANSSCTWPVLDRALGLQMCSNYSVPDLSNASDVYPSLLLSGPLNFSVILKKSDLSAKKYVFEYKWDQLEQESNWSLVFTTPGSKVPRVLVANVTSVPNAFNASVAFVNGASRASAGCSYDGNPDYRRLDVYLDTNGNRSLDLGMELRRYQDFTASIYKPRMLLAINGVNITGLVGAIKINEKNGIKQHDVELSFETKKLQAIVSGNIVQSEVTTSINMTANYRFQDNKIETINFGGRLVNNGDKSKTEYRGSMRLRTSAYPKLNFASNATWLSLQGHTEGILTYNNAADFVDPNYTSMVRLVFARSHSEDSIWDGSRTRASLELKVPKSRIDYRILVKHEERSKNGTEHNVIVGLKYAPEKEATGLFSIHLPRRNLFAVDAYVNVTVPEFNSSTLSLKINEKASKDYMIFVNGSWFTGHCISIKGNYKDRSSRVQALHHLKLIVESPSFEDTSLNIVYRRNQLLIFYDLQAKYGKDPYGLTVQYASNAHNRNSNAELRLKLRDKDYWINAKLLSEQPKLLQVEIHMDKTRDVHIKLGLLNMDKRKELSLELKWDANRDPTQRLGLLMEYNNPGNKHYDGNVMITYPERTINCGFSSYTGGPKYYGKAHASWSITDVIEFSYDAGIMPGKILHNWVQAEITTPFDGWRRNSLKAGIYNGKNLILVNSSLFWADDRILELGYKSDYEIRESLVSFDVRFGINSTIKDIPTINVKVKHWQDMKKFDTDLYLHYSGPNDTYNTYSIKSDWELLRDEHNKNVSGTVLLISPFEGYRKGGLVAKFMLNDQRQVSGAASLTFDIREFTLTMDGYVKKFTDNMLTVNITTPLEKFRTIHGRFGLNEQKRHAVAEVRAPTAALGAEVLADIKNLLNFDVKLSVATPIESFQQAALHAKMNTESVDMRGIWNNATLGFTGVWRMHNLTDFEYSYLVFTPLAGFEENGFIAQLLNRDTFILKLHGKLSHYKLGVKINGHPKSKLINQLGSNKIELEILYDEDFQPPATDVDYEQDDIDYEDYFSYFADFQVDTLVWPTIVGAVDIQEIFDFYLTVGHVQLPQGRLEFKDRLHYPDYINVLNVLTVNTPFEMAKDVKSILEYHIDLNFSSFYERVQFVVHDNVGKSQELGFELNYTKVMDHVTPKAHNVQLKLITPYEVLHEIDIHGRLELDDNAYKGNITSITATTHLSLAAAVENEDNFLETSVAILLETNVIPHYACQVYFKKDFSAVDNSVDIRFEVTDNGTINKLQIETDWHTNPANHVNVNGKVSTTMLPLQLAATSLLVTKGPNPQLNFDLSFLSRDGQSIAYGTRANKKKDVFNIEVWTPLKNYRNISMHGTIVRSTRDPRSYDINGNLYRNMATYGLRGALRMADSLPIDMTLRVQPKAGGRDGVIELNIHEAGPKKIRFSFSAIEDGKMCQISGGYSVSEDTGAMDFSVLVESTEPEIARINFYGNLKPTDRGRIMGDVNLQTPWKQLGIDAVHLHSDVDVRTDGGQIVGEYQIGKHIGRGNCLWSWILSENLQLVLESYMERPNAQSRIVHASAKYLNPGKNYQQLKTGGRLSVDSKWNLNVNGSLHYKSVDDFEFGVLAQLPLPMGDRHQLRGRYSGNVISKQFMEPQLYIEASYEALEAQRKLLTRLSYTNVSSEMKSLAHVEWGEAQNLSVVEANVEMLRKQDVRREFLAKITMPQFKDGHTLALSGHYDKANSDYHNVVCALDYPASRRIADVDVSFSSLTNMHGIVNSTTPFLNVSWFKTEFEFTTKNGRSYRYCRCDWPQDSAFFKLRSTYESDSTKHNLNGNIEMEVPLATRHRADIVYGLQERPNQDAGNVKVVYNEQQILDGKYKRVAQNKHPNYKDTTDITLENEMKPLGIHFVNTRDMRDPAGTRDIKHIEIYELRNTANFNLTGELHTRATINEQEFKVVAIHPNRAVVLTTKYEDVSAEVVRQHTKLELSETAWIGYNLELGNFSKSGNESQRFALELFYPKRNLSTTGWYYLTENRFNSDLAFKWKDTAGSKEQKIIRSNLLWQAEPLNKGDRDYQTFVLTVGHPYLEKDIKCRGSYYRGLAEPLKAQLTIDYSDSPEQLIVLGAQLKDLQQQLGHTNYTFKLYGHHQASELDVQLNGTLAARPSYYKVESTAYYKRDYFPIKYGKFLTLLDLNKRELEYERQTPYHSVRLWALPTIQHPFYGLNATVWDTPDTNHTGYVYVDLAERYARMEFNLTEDASQNLQMVGYIPDSRSGYLNIWRNYEEIRIIDVSSYLKMNHSRLITGRFHWRPNIKTELRDKFNGVGNSIYKSFSDGIDFWIKSLYTESMEAVGVVWETAKAYNKEFVDDVGQLSVLEEDLDDLRLFVNQSYEANDFYIKNLVNFTLTILDELAIRDHIESLPKIFTELWQAMGDSGKALRNSIVWLIETIKTTYNNLLAAVSRFFHGESLHYVSTLMAKGIEKYDKFVKDLHISFIKYIENLWHKFSHLASNYWKSVLKRIEPHMFKFISYIETTAWDLSKEVFDFIYKRTNELAESPYFNKVSSFTQDVDRLYRDIKSNDAITNIKKYSTLAWNFIKEKYFKLVPFGAELNEVFTEIYQEVKELEKIEQVQVVVQKYHELLAKLEWIAEELQLEQRLHQLYALVRNKFRNYAMNALETADMYREAKTKFIFDPEAGVLDLEQKLPMSWHAFNETPKFEEIPEYKILAKVQSFFSETNSTIIMKLYNMRTHLDPKTWLPPYYSRALLIDSRHYMTFDKRFVGLNLNFEQLTNGRANAQCSYLLAHDFFRRNFTLLLEPAAQLQTARGNDDISSRKLSFIANEQLIEIDLGTDHISINGNAQPILPLKLGSVNIYRELDILSITSDAQFSLHCNVQFDVCWFELSGWYFGQTAGLLGTLNNEPYDEYTTSGNFITTSAQQFTDSWSIQHCKQTQTTKSPVISKQVNDVCTSFFRTGILSACSAVVDPTPFHEMCLDLGMKSQPIRTGHPAVKGACAAALAYIETCTAMKVPMRVPDQCVFCQLANGSYVHEGTFMELTGANIPRSSDVVFIVEAKPCNADLSRSKSIMSVVASIKEQLQAAKISNNRYAVVAFGGAAPYDKPRSIIYERNVFTHQPEQLSAYFAHIHTGNGSSSDILQAISTASRLNFRPGVSKTFILLSCSSCAARDMRFDYTSILQYMLEEGVNLHILADTEFDFERTRKLRHFFGLDRELVYSKRFPEGDAETRKQVHIPKSNLGICTPLALETNGSVFSARKLAPERRYPINRFATIFAKRVAQSAVPIGSQTCECSGHNTGVAYVACSPAVYPEEKGNLDDYEDFNDWEWDDELDDDA